MRDKLLYVKKTDICNSDDILYVAFAGSSSAQAAIALW